SINFRYFFGPNFQRRICCLGNNVAIIPSPIIVIAAISLNLLPTIRPSLSLIEIDLSPLILARVPHMRPAVTFASPPTSGRRRRARRLRSSRPSATPDAAFYHLAPFPRSVACVGDGGYQRVLRLPRV